MSLSLVLLIQYIRIEMFDWWGWDLGCLAARREIERKVLLWCPRCAGGGILCVSWVVQNMPSVLLPAERTLEPGGSVVGIRPYRVVYESRGGREGGACVVQSARRNDRLSARYVPIMRYHEPRFTNVVHCYSMLEKYRRSTLLAARMRAWPPSVTYVVECYSHPSCRRAVVKPRSPVAGFSEDSA